METRETKRITLWGTAIIMLFLMALPGMVAAAEFNVSTAAELQAALDTAAGNGEADTINMAAGSYSTGDNGGEPFTYAPDSLDETHALTIVGAGADATIIDGGWSGDTATDGTPGMIIDLSVFRGDESDYGSDDSAATVTIQGITVQNANNMDYTSVDDYDIYGGLAVETNKADVIISNCKFTGNNNSTSSDSGGGLKVFTWSGDIILTDSTFSDNHGITSNYYGMDSGAGASLKSGRGNPLHTEGDRETIEGEDHGIITVTRCTFSGNGGDYRSGGMYGSPYADGGGLHAATSSGDITITDSIFKDNIAGGRYAGGGGASVQSFWGHITFTGNTVAGNIASTSGGGASIHSNFGEATVSDNTFKDNMLQKPPDDSWDRAHDGAGLHLKALNGSTVINNRFINNTNPDGRSSADGGGAHIGTNGCSYNAGVIEGEDNDVDQPDNYAATAGTIIRWNTFKGNEMVHSGGYADGGGLHARVASGYTLEAAYNSFISNTAEGVGGGALFNNAHGTILLLSNYFYDNRANTVYSEHYVGGGGAFVDTAFGTANVVNNTFESNTTVDYGGGGLGVNLQEDYSAVNLYNNLFYGNDAGTGANSYGDDIHINDLNTNTWPADLITDNTGAEIVLDTNRYDDAYILSRDGADSANDTPNITESGTTDADPLFLAAGSPQLDADSPMIDAGNASAPNLPGFDIFRMARAHAAPVDIGAYEEVELAIASTDATVSLAPSVQMPSGLDDVEVSGVVGFIATDVTTSADIYITFPRLPANFTIYKVLASGQHVQIYPQNKAGNMGITNVRLNGNVLGFTVLDDSEADWDDTVGTIEDPVVVVEEDPVAVEDVGSAGSESVLCFIDTIRGKMRK